MPDLNEAFKQFVSHMGIPSYTADLGIRALWQQLPGHFQGLQAALLLAENFPKPARIENRNQTIPAAAQQTSPTAVFPNRESLCKNIDLSALFLDVCL
jgi:hypothetical protein